MRSLLDRQNGYVLEPFTADFHSVAVYPLFVGSCFFSVCHFSSSIGEGVSTAERGFVEAISSVSAAAYWLRTGFDSPFGLALQFLVCLPCVGEIR